MNSFSSYKKKKRLIIVTGSVLTMVILIIVYRDTHKPIPAEITREAKIFDVSPYQLNDIDQIEAKLFGNEPVSAAEWKRYSNYAMGSNLVFKRKVARHLCAARNTKYSQSALSMTRQLIDSSDPQTRACALISLKVFNTPDWQNVAKSFLNDPNPAPRNMAQNLLSQVHH